jgi:hypothetical protein
MIDVAKDGHAEFGQRLALNALALRYQLDHQQLQVDWAKWAAAQIETWNSPTDPAGWDWYAELQPERAGASH